MSLMFKESYQLKPSSKQASKLVQTIERLSLLMETLNRTHQDLSVDELAAVSVSDPLTPLLPRILMSRGGSPYPDRAYRLIGWG